MKPVQVIEYDKDVLQRSALGQSGHRYCLGSETRVKKLNWPLNIDGVLWKM